MIGGICVLESLYKKNKTGRFDVFVYVVIVVFLVLIARLVYLQIIEGEYYQSKAEGNRLRMVSMTAARGIMYDRNGQILVGSRPAYTVSIMPTGKEIDEKTLISLASLLKTTPDILKEKISSHKGGYEPIRLATDITMDVVTKIEEHHDEFPGVTIDVEPLRYYPYDSLASQLFGYVGEISEEELFPIIDKIYWTEHMKATTIYNKLKKDYNILEQNGFLKIEDQEAKN